MEKFIPVNKQTKKKQKEYFAKKRNDWGGLNPMTRTVPNGKGYNRKKQRAQDRKSGRLFYYNEDRCRFCIIRIWEEIC